jgi:hypothetical protein
LEGFFNPRCSVRGEYEENGATRNEVTIAAGIMFDASGDTTPLLTALAGGAVDLIAAGILYFAPESVTAAAGPAVAAGTEVAASGAGATGLTAIGILGLAAGFYGTWSVCQSYYQDRIHKIGQLLLAAYNDTNPPQRPVNGVALYYTNNKLRALNRQTGALYELQLDPWNPALSGNLPPDLSPGIVKIFSDDPINVQRGFHLVRDVQ